MREAKDSYFLLLSYLTPEIPAKPRKQDCTRAQTYIVTCSHVTMKHNRLRESQPPHRAAAAAAKSLQSCPTPCNPIDGSPPGSPVPGILQEEHRVGCHFLLQCMKVKSESEVAQSYPTLRNSMDCSPPGSSVHGIFQARVLECGAIAFSSTPE